MDHNEEDGFVIINPSWISTPDAPVPWYLDDVSRHIDDIADNLWPVNKTIHDNPELGYAEHIAHDVLTRFMASQPGWAVTRSAYDIETAWTAVFDPGQREGAVISFNAEMGASPPPPPCQLEPASQYIPL